MINVLFEHLILFKSLLKHLDVSYYQLTSKSNLIQNLVKLDFNRYKHKFIHWKQQIMVPKLLYKPQSSFERIERFQSQDNLRVTRF